jgi:hypothetical protein
MEYTFARTRTLFFKQKFHQNWHWARLQKLSVDGFLRLVQQQHHIIHAFPTRNDIYVRLAGTRRDPNAVQMNESIKDSTWCVSAS